MDEPRLPQEPLLPSMRLAILNDKDQMEYHHVWFWAKDKDVRNFLMVAANVPSGEVVLTDYVTEAVDREFTPCFSEC